MGRPALSLALVGVDYPNKRGPTRAFELALMKPGDRVELRREPKNPADPHAVAVYSLRGIQLGYLTAERAPWIGGMINNGRELRCVMQQKTAWGAVLRCAFDGETPTLPPAKERDDVFDDSGFYPDAIWPDD